MVAAGVKRRRNDSDTLVDVSDRTGDSVQHAPVEDSFCASERKGASASASVLATEKAAPRSGGPQQHKTGVRFTVVLPPSATAELAYPNSGLGPERLRIARAGDWDRAIGAHGAAGEWDPHSGIDLFWEGSQWTSLITKVPAESELIFCLLHVKDDPDILQLHPWEARNRRRFKWEHEFTLHSPKVGEVLEVELSFPAGKVQSLSTCPRLSCTMSQTNLRQRLSSQSEGSQRCYTFDGPAGVTFDFSLYLPPGFGNASRPWPVLVFMHAQHSCLDGDISLFFESEAPPQLLLGSHQCPQLLRSDFVVLCPQCPRDLSHMYSSGIWFYTDWYGKRAYMPEVEDDLAALITMLTQDPRLDRDFVTMTGTSMGGLGCLEFASRRAGLVKAVVPVAAHYEFDLDELAERMTRDQCLPVWFFHAFEDTLCPFERIEKLVCKLKAKSRAEVRFTSYRDSWSVNGHCADRVSYHVVPRSHGQDAMGNELFAWILQQRQRCC